jgi:hypothetical protein
VLPPLEGKPCDDGKACTAVDTCGGGVCAGQDVTCTDADPCTSDGGLWAVGTALSQGLTRPWLLRLDSNGEAKVNVALPVGAGATPGKGVFEGVAVLPGGDVVAVGSEDVAGSNTTDAVAARFQPDGKLVWRTLVGLVPGAKTPVTERLHAVAVASAAAGLIAVGDRGHDKAPELQQDGWVVREQPDGKWQATAVGTPENDLLHHVTGIPGTGDFVASGFSEGASAGMTDAWLLRLNASGDVVWQAKAGDKWEDEWRAATVIGGGKTILAVGLTRRSGVGNATFDGLFGVYGLDGTPLKDGASNALGAVVLDAEPDGKPVQNGGQYDSFHHVAPALDGGAIAVGRTCYVLYCGYRLTRFSATGAVVWQRRNTVYFNTPAWNAHELHDGSLLVVGTSGSTKEVGDPFAVRFEADGKTVRWQASGTFNTGSTFVGTLPAQSTAAIWGAALTADGNAIVFGHATSGAGGEEQPWAARLHVQTGHAGGIGACKDKPPCTELGRDTWLGCQVTRQSVPCEDGNECTSGDACTGGQCVDTFQNACDDGNPCTADACTAGGGCFHSGTAAGSSCAPGKVCASGSCGPCPWTGTLLPRKGFEEVEAAARPSDGGVVLAGYTGAGTGPKRDGWVGRFDAAGKVLWEKAVGDPGLHEALEGVAVLPDGSGVAVGWREVAQNDLDAWLASFDANGNLADKVVQGGAGMQHLRAATTAGGKLVVGGEVAAHGWVAHVDPAGTPQWTSVVQKGAHDTVYGLAAALDGGLFACGTTRSAYNAEADFLLARLDANGQTLWTMTAATVAVHEHTRAVVALPDGGAATVGNAPSFFGSVVRIRRHDAQSKLVWSVHYDSLTLVDFGAAALLGNRLIAVGEGNGGQAVALGVELGSGVVWEEGVQGGSNSRWRAAVVGPGDGVTAVGRVDTGPQTGWDAWVKPIGKDGQMFCGL